MPSKFALTLKRYSLEASTSGVTPYGCKGQGNISVLQDFCPFSELIFLSISSHLALFYFLWGSRQDVHDDVQTLAECSPGQGTETSTSLLGWDGREVMNIQKRDTCD